jgi:hypothetical protein
MPRRCPGEPLRSPLLGPLPPPTGGKGKPFLRRRESSDSVAAGSDLQAPQIRAKRACRANGGSGKVQTPLPHERARRLLVVFAGPRLAGGIVQAGASEAGPAACGGNGESGVHGAERPCPPAESSMPTLKGRMEKLGRSREHMKILPACFVVVATLWKRPEPSRQNSTALSINPTRSPRFPLRSAIPGASAPCAPFSMIPSGVSLSAAMHLQ